MSFVTCKNIGLSLIQWIEQNGGEEICAALACADVRLKDVSFSDGKMTFVIGDQKSTANDRRLVVDVDGGGGGEIGPYVVKVEERGPGVFVALMSDGSEVGWTAEEYDPEFLYLINPTVYLDTVAGQTSPPIASQADLTPANAFRSWDNIFTFLDKTLVQGTLTVLAKGQTSGQITFNTSRLAGASSMELRAVDNNPATYTHMWGGGSDGWQHGFLNDGISVLIGNVRMRGIGTSSWANAIETTNGGLTRLSGQITFDGNMSNQQNFLGATASARVTSARRLAAGTDGEILTLVLNPAEGSRRFVEVSTAARMDLRDTKIQLLKDIPVSVACAIDSGAVLVFDKDPGSGGYPTAFTGPGNFVGGAFRITRGGGLQFDRINAVSFPHDNIKSWMRVTGDNYTVDRSSTVAISDTIRFGTSGTDYT